LPTSPSSSAQQARQALADQLREIRETADLTARALAGRLGWRTEKVSRIEHGTRAAAKDAVRDWCEACGVSPERRDELLAEQRAVAGMWVTYQRSHRAGLRQAQAAVRPLYERAALMRCYEPAHIPGLLQTAEYTAAGLTAVRRKLDLAMDDVTEAVAERMDRQKVLRSGQRRFAFLIEEQVLNYRPVPHDVHTAQLHHLMEVMNLPSVAVGIIPTQVDRSGLWPPEMFYMFDDQLVAVELVSGVLEVTQPAEVAMYVQMFATMSALATTGDAARGLITQALENG
jgi:transcriptional regulator with XRE-family HTH domain